MRKIAFGNSLLICLGLTLVADLAFAHEHSGTLPADAKLGTVAFQTSCKPEVQGNFNRGIALLHSFWFSEAQHAFEAVASADPNCGMAYWGIGMSYFRLWSAWPGSTELSAGRAALKKADAASEKTPRERDYISALSALYDDFKPAEPWRYVDKYAAALGKIAADYPSDVEARVFWALVLMVSQPPDDENRTKIRQALNILTPLLQQYPDHPGIAHYLIHATDTPEFASQGLEAARRYAKIAPAAPHALHMPSHIFARLGLWQEDIQSNLASKAAAEQPHAGVENRLHAMEFLEYAYLQLGEDDKAEQIVSAGKAVKLSDLEERYASYYATVENRFRALYLIETKDWLAAARLEPTLSDTESGRWVILLAHAMAAGHLRNVPLADTTFSEAKEWIKKQNQGKPLPKSGSREAGFLDEIEAWKYFADGRADSAVRLLVPIADREDREGKGEVDLPVRESLAEMFLLSGKPEKALEHYELSLKTDPNRFNALLGAGRAAEQVSRPQTAREYYRQLVANCTHAKGPAIIELAHARALLADPTLPTGTAAVAKSSATAGPIIRIEDVARFYRLYDAEKGHPTAEQLQKEYLDVGSEGLHRLAELRHVTGAAIAASIDKNPQLFSDAKRCMAVLPGVRERLQAVFQKLRRSYPEAQFPPVTIAISRGKPVGVADSSGVMIGLELLCATAWMNPNVEDRFVHVIAHEYVHVQQALAAPAFYDNQNPTVLEESLIEGAGEFAAELISGQTSYSNLGAAAKGREKEVESAFAADESSTDLSKWLYNSSLTQPGDLGYWVGYRIVKSYYAHADEKRQAFREIIQLTDAKAFLSKSGWYPGILLKSGAH
ncbi:MAG TPA: DUF2268 domain-containing putative Zn-dependent protease [Xanthobacteraceae bacterium]|jgi:tetratricopeptide (TPR) repeat protein